MPAFLNDPRAMTVPPIESPFAKNLIEQADLDPVMREKALSFERDGYVILDLDLPDFDAMAERIIRDLGPKYPDGNRRVTEAWMFHEDARAIACAPAVIQFLETVYQRYAIPFQTLNFDVGTQQCTHSDSLHFYSFPHRYMCGGWVALEDIDENNGPLHYYPGSHKLREYDMYDIALPSSYDHYESYERFIENLAETHGFKREMGLVKRGQCIIWSANLLHGGNAVKEPGRTRHSQVTHYFFEDCIYYLPMNTEPFAGKIEFREVIDIRTGRFVPHRYKGEYVSEREQDTVWRYPRPLPDWVTAPTDVPLPGFDRGKPKKQKRGKANVS